MDNGKMTDSEKMLDIRHISFQYDEDDYVLFDDISFTVGRGEFVSLIGPSGSGKSTIRRQRYFQRTRGVRLYAAA